MNKLFIASITRIDDGKYQLTVIEMDKNGFNRSHELEFCFCLNDNMNWEKEQVRHYLEYEKGQINVLTNNEQIWLLLAPTNMDIKLQ